MHNRPHLGHLELGEVVPSAAHRTVRQLKVQQRLELVNLRERRFPQVLQATGVDQLLEGGKFIRLQHIPISHTTHQVRESGQTCSLTQTQIAQIDHCDLSDPRCAGRGIERCGVSG